MIQVAILSPMPVLRAGLRALLGGDPEVRVVGDGARPEELADSLDQAGVILATAGGMDLAAAGLLPDQALLWVTDAPDVALARALDGLELRAWGILPPDATSETLHAAVRALREGLCVVPPEALRAILDQVPADNDEALPAQPRPALVNGIEEGEISDPLTAREQDVLMQLAQGLTNKQIAHLLGISEHTVKFHVSAIYSKLGVANRAEAVRIGARLGWLPL